MKIEDINLKGKALVTEVLAENSRWELDEDIACSRINGFVDQLHLPNRYAMLIEIWWEGDISKLYYRLVEYNKEDNVIVTATPAVPDKTIVHWILAGLSMGISNQVTNIHNLITQLKEEN